jgi:uncharacterized membrane protein
MITFEIARTLHIAAGVAALSTFWVPMVATKGGALHRRVGWAYVASTAAIAVTALVVCVGRLIDDEPKNDGPAIFLAYVALFSGATASYGVRVLQTKTRTSAHRGVWDLALPSALVACGLALATFGVTRHAPLYVGFAALGLFVGVMQLRFWARPPATERAWWFAHMNGMGTSSIATLTAFFVLNAHRIGLGTWSLVVWFAPAIVGGFALAFWQRRYRSAFASSAALERRP